MKDISPLRYPGGKGKITGFLQEVIEANNLVGCTYIEPYAGGAGAALKLLDRGVVSKIVINDLDPNVFAFWKAVTEQTDAFIEKIQSTSVSYQEWLRQKDIMQASVSNLERGFAFFFLNRCNRSGILKAGPIGGKNQAGQYKIDVRFNKENLIRRINFIRRFLDRIEVTNYDAIDLVKHLKIQDSEAMFVYLDPPYYARGKELYLNYYDNKDHIELAVVLKKTGNIHWLLTYDDSDFIRCQYQEFQQTELPIYYSAGKCSKASELCFYSDNMTMLGQ